FGWTYGSKRVKYRHHRAFWKFLDEPTIFVVGGFAPNVLLGTLDEELKQVIGQEQDRRLLVDRVMNHLNRQEISGLVGQGDLDAIVTMIGRFASLRLPTNPVIVHPTQVGERRYQNLVLVGGKDVNSLTEMLTPRLGCHLEALTGDDGHNVIRDSRLNVDYPAMSSDEPGANGEIRRVDYGVLA